MGAQRYLPCPKSPLQGDPNLEYIRCHDQHEVQSFLLPGWSRSGIRGRRPVIRLDGPPSIRLPSTLFDTGSGSKNLPTSSASFSGGSMVAKATVVSDTSATFQENLLQATYLTGSLDIKDSEQHPSLSPQNSISFTDNMEHKTLTFSTRVRNTIRNSCKQSTRLSYHWKWAHFSRWLLPSSPSPTSAGIPLIFYFLIHLVDKGLSYPCQDLSVSPICVSYAGGQSLSILTSSHQALPAGHSPRSSA